MLPSLHQKAYRELIQVLMQLQQNLADLGVPITSLELGFQRVQNVFRTQIIQLTSEGLEPNLAPKWQSVQTEIYRTFKLLETDMLFLRSSRYSATVQTRKANIGKRISRLIGYCRKLLNE